MSGLAAAPRRRSRGRGRGVPCRRGARAARRTRPCRTPAASAASKRRERVAGRDEVGALVADRASASGIRGTSMSCGCRRPARGRGSARRSAGTGGRRGRRSAGARVWLPSRADCCMRGRVRRTIAQRLVVADVAGRAATGRPRRRSSPRTSTGCRCPAIVRWSSRASPIGARRVVLAQPAQEAALVELGGEDVGPEAGEALVEARAGRGHAARARARRTARRRGRAARSTSHARRGERAPALTVAVDAPRAGHAQVRVDDAGRPRSAGTGACRGRRRPRPRARPAARASGRRRSAGGASASSSGTRPSSTGRIRLAAWWMVSPSGTALRGYGPSARALAERASSSRRRSHSAVHLRAGAAAGRGRGGSSSSSRIGMPA